MLHTNAISFTNKFSKIRKNIRLCKFKNKNTRILLDKIVLSLPAIFLQDLFQFLLYFPFFIWSNLDFLITGWPLTYSEILKMKKKKKFLTFRTIPPKDMKIQVQFFFRMIKLYKRASKP